MNRNIILKQLINNMQLEWEKFDSALKEIANIPQFLELISNYRGLSTILTQNLSVREDLGERLCQFFINLFAEYKSYISDLSITEVDLLLREFECTVNLALYYWQGSDDRNFQFRTVVHFANLEGMGAPLLALPKEYYVSISENGLRFGAAEDAHLPLTSPITAALALNEFIGCKVNSKALLARLRTVQREICLLEEEWEHRNALLAVEYTEIRDAHRKNPNSEREVLLTESTINLSRHRNLLAKWCLQSFQNLQHWLAAIRPTCLSQSDLNLEWQAIDALILSGIQKILLPASVSRHKYEAEVVTLFAQWCTERLASTPDDFATRLVQIACLKHLGKTATFSENVLSQKEHQWLLSFDPIPALKAFCWNIDKVDHYDSCILAALALVQKCHSQTLSDYWLTNVISLAVMPDSFGSPQPQKNALPQLEHPLYQNMHNVLQRVTIPPDFVNHAKEFQEYIKEQLV